MTDRVRRIDRSDRSVRLDPPDPACEYHPVSKEPGVDVPRGIGAPATGALVGEGYASLGTLAGVPATDLAKLHGVGSKAPEVLREVLKKQGRSLG